MRSILKSVILTISLVVSLATCEIEKTEYKKVTNDDSFPGFSYSLFILHSKSISYYSQEENKAFSDIYFHQNGRTIKNGIHSLQTFGETGIITFQNDNVIEWIDMVNFFSEGFLEIDKPRDIYPGYPYCLVSFGDKITGGVAVIDFIGKEIVKIIHMETEAGRIYDDNEYLFVFSNGNNFEDSLLYRLFSPGPFNASIHKLDSFVIGIRPVDGVGMNIVYPDFEHKGLAVLCKGNVTVPASIVMLDLVTGKVAGQYFFESTTLKPENLFWLVNYDNNTKKLVSYINNKLYNLTLNDRVKMSVLIDKNISDLLRLGKYLLGVSRDTVETSSSLYRFDPITLELFDSLSIDGKALKFAGIGM